MHSTDAQWEAAPSSGEKTQLLKLNNLSKFLVSLRSLVFRGTKYTLFLRLITKIVNLFTNY